MNLNKWIIAALMICMVPAYANAELERTVWAWDTRTPDTGKCLATLWSGYETYRYKEIEVDAKRLDFTFSLSYGMAENWSVGFQTGFHRWQEKGYGKKYSKAGIDDSSLITTFRLFDEADTGVDLAFRGALGLPTGNEDKYLGTGNWEPKLEVLASKTFGKLLTVANIGIKQIVDSAQDEADFIFDADLECVLPLTRRLSASAVLTGWSARWKPARDDAYVQAGAGLKFTPTEKSFISGAAYRLLDSDLYGDDWYLVLSMGGEF